MTTFYYIHQSGTFREATPEEHKRFHMDYEPGETKQQALQSARKWAVDEILKYAGYLAWRHEVLAGIDKLST